MFKSQNIFYLVIVLANESVSCSRLSAEGVTNNMILTKSGCIERRRKGSLGRKEITRARMTFE